MFIFFQKLLLSRWPGISKFLLFIMVPELTWRKKNGKITGVHWNCSLFNIIILSVRQQLGNFGNHFEWEHSDAIDSILLLQLKLVQTESFLTCPIPAEKSVPSLIALFLSLVEQWILLESILYLFDTYYSHLFKYLLILKVKQTSKNQDIKLYVFIDSHQFSQHWNCISWTTKDALNLKVIIMCSPSSISDRHDDRNDYLFCPIWEHWASQLGLAHFNQKP